MLARAFIHSTGANNLGGSLASSLDGTCVSGKSSDFPGVVRNPLHLVRFRQTDRFWAPLSETGPAPPTPWSKRSNSKILKNLRLFVKNDSCIFIMVHARTKQHRGEEETTTQRQAPATVASTEKSEGKTPTCSGRGAICHVTAPPGFYAASPWGGYARDKGGETGARSARSRTKVIGRAS